MAIQNMLNKLILESRQHDEALKESGRRVKELEKENKRLSASMREAGQASRQHAGAARTGAQESGLFANATGSLGDEIRQGAGILLKFASAGAVVAGAIQVAKDAFMSSESNIDEWGRTVEGAKGMYHAFVVSLGSGDWDGLLSKLGEANQAARDLFDAFDALGSMQVNDAPLIASLESRISKLRLRKQQGENVSDELQAATAALSAVKGRHVEQGKKANLLGIVNELKARGMGAVDAERYARELTEGGQAVVDRETSTYERLKKKGTKDTEKYFFAGDGGVTTSVRSSKFDINALTPAEQKQYKNAKAVVEGETGYSKHMLGFANSINAETAANKQEYKYNSMAGVGKGGKTEKEYESKISAETFKMPTNYGMGNVASLDALEKRLGDYKKQLKEATNSADYTAAEAGIARTTREIEAQPVALRMGLSIEDVLRMEDQIKSLRDGLELKPIEIKVDTSNLAKGGRDIATAYNGAFAAVSSIGGALANVDNKGLNVAGTIMQAVANVALGFAASLKGTATPWDFIAGAAAGLATMTATIMAIKKQTAGSFADGGIVGGNSYTGDRLWAHVNSQEMILNTRQQANILSKIEGSQGGGTGGGVSSISGEQIVTVINAYGRRTGRGEILR